MLRHVPGIHGIANLMLVSFFLFFYSKKKAKTAIDVQYLVVKGLNFKSPSHIYPLYDLPT